LKNRDTGKVKSYSEGDTLDIIETEPVRVLKIDNCVVIVQRARARESITCNKDVKGVQSASSQNVTLRPAPAFAGPVSDSQKQGINRIGEDVFEIDRGFLDEKLSNLNDLLTQARVVPTGDGIKFLAIRRNSLFYDIGLRNGDTLHRINDVTLDNVENALGLFEELKQQNNFKIDITRRGKPLTYEYRVR
jgi:type II secretory pathway component PulC